MTAPPTLGETALLALLHGVGVDPAAARGPLAACFQLKSGGERVLDIGLGPRWRLAVSPATGPEAPVRLEMRGEAGLLEHAGCQWPVAVAPRPAFLGGAAPSGQPRAALCRTHFNFLLFHPLHLQPEGAERTLWISPPTAAAAVPLRFDDVLDTVDAALDEGEIDCVALRWVNRVTPGEVDQALAPLLKTIKRNFDVVVTAECPAPREPGAVDLLYAEGADAISFPVLAVAGGGLSDAQRPAPLDQTLEALARAVTVFPKGTVLSPLRIGLESPLDTLSSITRLARMGVSAGLDLALLRAEWTTLRRAWALADLRRVWEHLEEELRHAHLDSPWTPHPLAQAVAIPADAFRPDWPGDQGGGFRQSRAGQLLLRNLIRLRRRLRVRRVEQSFESAEL